MSAVVETVRVLNGLLTSKRLAKLFCRSELTITIWRNTEGLPYVRIPGDERDTIRFDLEQVKEWANKTGRRMRLLLDGDENGSG